MKGTHIVIEGGDGAGKDTQWERLHVEFGDKDFIYTRQPGGTQLGQELRNILLHESCGKVSLSAELLLFLGDRAQHVEEVIKPSLAAGKHVVSNRSWISFMAYQIYGRQQFEWKQIVELSLEKIFKDVPIDCAIILDVPVEVGQERQRSMGKAPDVMESMTTETRERIRLAFLDIAKSLPQARIIDANRPVEEVWSEVKAAVQSVL